MRNAGVLRTADNTYIRRVSKSDDNFIFNNSVKNEPTLINLVRRIPKK